MADDDGEVDLSDLTIERLWQVAKRHTQDPSELIEIVVLATTAGLSSDDLAAMLQAAADDAGLIGETNLGSGALPLSGGAERRAPGDGILGRIG